MIEVFIICKLSPVTCADIDGGKHTADQTTERGPPEAGIGGGGHAQDPCPHFPATRGGHGGRPPARSSRRSSCGGAALDLSFAPCPASCAWAAFFLTRTAGGARAFAARVTHAFALAWCADAAPGPAIGVAAGVLAAHLDTHLAAGLLECWATRSRTDATVSSRQLARRRRSGSACWGFPPPAGVAWIVWHSAEYRVGGARAPPSHDRWHPRRGHDAARRQPRRPDGPEGFIGFAFYFTVCILRLFLS